MSIVVSDEEFEFNRNDEIGSAGAEDDQMFLDSCFVDKGDLKHLKDCNDPKRIIIGRTGAGKSALLNQLSKQDRTVAELSPHALSLNFVANNELISFFENNGVNLSVFYGLLWKHILVVELLKLKYDIKDQASQKRYMNQIRSLVYKKDHMKEMAVEYFENWGDRFWLTTEERIKEITKKVETGLKGSMNGSLSGISFSANAQKTISEEERKDITERGQKAVSQVQIRELENMMSVLSENIFTDPQEPYYITIDTLDEGWADNRIKYKLIKSLMETVQRFRKVKNVKIILSLRQDLLDKVLHSDHESGFQEEKYESLYLDLVWNQKLLVEVVNKRISSLVKRRYIKKEVTSVDIFRSSVDGLPALTYMINRTFNRPRDLILFVNECIKKADNSQIISSNMIKKAEEEYSYKRLQSLATEWLIIYPNLEYFMYMFESMNEHFNVSDLTETWFLEKYTEQLDYIDSSKKDPLIHLMNKLFDNNSNLNSVRINFLRELFKTGFLGIKSLPGSSTSWSTDSRLSISLGQIKPSSSVYIHPMFFRALNIRCNKKI